MKIAIIKYNAGNVQSVQHALDRLNVNSVITDNFEEIQLADKVIFPGVGEASTTMEYLHKSGLSEVIKNLKQPVLGICLGMQLMCSHSEEGNVPCLGIFNQKVKLFNPNGTGLKVPHIGWNNLTQIQGTIVPKNVLGEFVYFVHSYYVELGKETAATCDYILPFSAALQKDNFYATQFHPEKSGDVGAEILKNFVCFL